MARTAAALFALALPGLGGCAGDDHEILIHNQGTQAIVVEVEVAAGWSSWDHPDDDVAIIPPGGFYKERFPRADEVDVFISRQSDGMLLFVESFDTEDFEDEHGTIDIVVAP